MILSRLAGSVALALACAGPAIAQTQSQPPPPATGTIDGQNHTRGGGFMHILQSLNLTPSQRQQIDAIYQQYQQSHPPGSPPDRAAIRAARQRVMQILTPDQRQQLRSQIQQLRAHYLQQQGVQPEPESSPSPVP
jgi:Spy/CpxP family protein refolding chaperone